MSSEIILYQTEDGLAHVQLRAIESGVWLSQKEMADLFATTIPNINIHIRNILKENELPADSVIKESLTTAADGKNYRTRLYRLEMILAIGYRVKGPRGTQFRQWATQGLPQRGCVSKPRVARNELPWDVGQTCHQPQRGCVTPTTPCLNPYPPSISTLCSLPRTADHFSMIPLSARKCTPTSRAHPGNSIARPSSRAGSRTMFTCWPGTDAPSLSRIGSRKSSASPAFGSKRATSRCMILPGRLVTASFPSAHQTWTPSAITWPGRRNTIGSPRFKTSSGPCCGNMEWNGTNDTCGIEPAPTGLRPKAQGWCGAPTLGGRLQKESNPNGVAADSDQGLDAIPLGLMTAPPFFPRVAAGRQPLGLETQPRWG